MPNKISENCYINIEKDYISGMRLIDLERKYNKPSSNIIEHLRKIGIFVPKSTKWTKDEIEFLKNNYSTATWDILLKNINTKSKDCIIHKAYKLKIPRSLSFWDESEIEILKDCYNHNMSGKDIVSKLNNKYSIASIYAKASNLGIYLREEWSEKEIDILRKYYSIIPLNELVSMLGDRDKDTIKTMAYSYGLKSYFYLQRQWTNDMDKYIQDNWNEVSDKDMSKYLNRTWRAVKYRREYLGLYRIIEPGKYDYLYEYIRKRNKQWKKRICGKL